LGIDFGSIYRKDKRKQLRKFIYKRLYEELVAATQEEIKKEFPKEIHRRNTGYAVDILLNRTDFQVQNLPLMWESYFVVVRRVLTLPQRLPEGRYFPPTNNVMVVAHFQHSRKFRSGSHAMKHHLYTCEMMDDTILNCTKTNREQAKK
jgi:hypothetical protein